MYIFFEIRKEVNFEVEHISKLNIFESVIHFLECQFT